MPTGLDATFSVLAKSQNEAAVQVLLSALDVQDRSVQLGALEAILKRRSVAGHRELLRRWHTLSKHWKHVIADSGSRMSNVIRDAILGSDEQLHANGCDAAIVLNEYDLIPALITAAEDKNNPHGDLSAETLLLLADALSEELILPQDHHQRRSPRSIRSQVVGALQQSVERFDQHKRRETVEAFLILVSPENPVLKHMLQHPHGAAYVTLVHVLSHSHRLSVMCLILDSLNDNRASSAIYSILAHRQDISFVRHMLKRFVEKVPKTATRNLKRVDSFSWLQDDMKLLGALNGDEQRGVIHLLMASGVSRIRVLEVIDFILRNGTTEGRREAAQALTQFRDAKATTAVLHALEDEDPGVRAIAVSQIRERGIRGAMTTLLELVDSSDELVSEAAREALSEYTFASFLNAFGTLDEETLAETARFVKRVDRTALDGLREELTSPIRVRRIRAIEMAVAMTAVQELEPLIIHLLNDDDHVIRAAAADALVQSPSIATRTALRDAMLDRSQTVRDIAEYTLQTFVERDFQATSNADSLPVDLSEFQSYSESGQSTS